MISSHRLLLVACLTYLLPIGGFAEAPVVDDSENFALLDDQQISETRPLAREVNTVSSHDEETALANDSITPNTPPQAQNATLLDKIQGLQQDVQELRGQLEIQAHDLKLLQQQQLAFYKDLDSRLNSGPAKIATKPQSQDFSINANTTPKPTAQVSAPSAAMPWSVTPVIGQAAKINPADEQISYLAAYELVKNKHFDEALPVMQSFVSRYPQGGYTGNAQYWLGELYMVKKDYPKAISHFEIVLDKFPSSSKSAASLLKIGYALALTGKKQDAIDRLQQVVKNYPDTTTAKLAKNKLDALTS
jgi:tol-pal system protein YbgF